MMHQVDDMWYSTTNAKNQKRHDTKMKICTVMVIPVLMYASETWTMTQKKHTNG